jgi:Asp-tRNA(Asn)/Glu-tRNA(Gln) amidotransferase A subunit family amidase
MVPAAIGSQVGGSIGRPASYCANYSLKPSQGAIHRGERQATSMSTHGPHAGCLEDMWAVAIEIAVRTGGDPGCAALSGPLVLPAPHRPFILAVMETEGWGGLDEASRSAFEQVVSQVEAAGVTVLRRANEPELERFEQLLIGVRKLTIDITAWENQWAMRNLIARNREGVSLRSKAGFATAARIGAVGYQDLLRRRGLIRSEYAAFATRIDAMIAPASPGPAPIRPRDVPGEPPIPFPSGDPVFNPPSSLLGAPVVTVPLTAVGGLPMGIQIMGQAGTDPRMTAIARWMRDAVRPVSV